MAPPRRRADPAKYFGSGRTVGGPAPDEARPTVGIDLGGSKILFAVVGADGRVVRSHRRAVPPGGRPSETVEILVRGLTECLGPDGRPPAAIGIGVAGQVNRDGVVVTSPNLKWHRVPLRARVSAAVGIPVTVTNDVRAVTFGEWKYGAARGVDDLVCVFVGTGIGGGIVADGRLRYGASDTAGEIGHMTIVANGRPCHCRNVGCLEAYAGGWAIAARAQEAVRESPRAGRTLRRAAGGTDAISAATVGAAARRGDPLARRIVSETTEYLAAGLVGVVNAFNPEVLVLGGGVIEGMPSLLAEVRRKVRQRSLRVAARSLSIVRAGLGARAGAVGAAAMARHGVPGGR